VLSERGSLILPIDHPMVDALAGGALGGELSLGELRLYRKREHHMTVLNYGIGKLIQKAIAAKGALRDQINTLAGAYPWQLRAGAGGFHHLAQESPGKPRLQTVVLLIDADLAGFYARLRAQVAEAGLPDPAPLIEALGAPPPPHVTLYTSDPEGKAGIGLNRIAELDAAHLKAADPADTTPGLRAYRLQAGQVRPA